MSDLRGSTSGSCAGLDPDEADHGLDVRPGVPRFRERVEACFVEAARVLAPRD